MPIQTRRQRQNIKTEPVPDTIPSNDDTENIKEGEEDEVEEEEENVEYRPATFTFDNKKFYKSYEEMVKAKRERNREMLFKSGLLEASTRIKDDMMEEDMKRKAAAASQRGIKRVEKRKRDDVPLTRRKSNRLAGVKADGFYVENEQSGKLTIGGGAGDVSMKGVVYDDSNEREQFFNRRVNDGSELSVKEAVEMTGAKWVKDSSVSSAEYFMGKALPGIIDGTTASKEETGIGALPVISAESTPSTSPISVRSSKVGGSKAGKRGARRAIDTTESKSHSSLISQVESISLDDPNYVAKVTPERIYAVCCHPSPHSLLVGAGDKNGYVGLWNVDQPPSDSSDGAASSDGVNLFKIHGGAVSHMEWNTSGSSLYTTSYDGSVRQFDVATQTFSEVFATYDESSEYKDKLGYGLDEGYKYWIQYSCMDTRNGSDQCLFLSSSRGTVFHVDLRRRGKISFHETLSEKKINTVSLHPNGTTLATAGLDTTVALWDIRNFSGNSQKSKSPKPIAVQHCGKSVNSSYFSPSGRSLLSTTMADNLDLITDAHLQSGLIKKPDKRIRHDNKTGRWLSTFMARWHPHASSAGNDEMFVVGSMRRPRSIELFNDTEGKLLRALDGEALSAVVSRCCFHPSSDRLMVIGGSSSGRVTIAR